MEERGSQNGERESRVLPWGRVGCVQDTYWENAWLLRGELMEATLVGAVGDDRRWSQAAAVPVPDWEVPFLSGSSGLWVEGVPYDRDGFSAAHCFCFCCMLPIKTSSSSEGICSYKSKFKSKHQGTLMIRRRTVIWSNVFYIMWIIPFLSKPIDIP